MCGKVPPILPYHFKVAVALCLRWSKCHHLLKHVAGFTQKGYCEMLGYQIATTVICFCITSSTMEQELSSCSSGCWLSTSPVPPEDDLFGTFQQTLKVHTHNTHMHSHMPTHIIMWEFLSAVTFHLLFILIMNMWFILNCSTCMT